MTFPHIHHWFEYIFHSAPTILWRPWQSRLCSGFSGPPPTCSWTSPGSWWCLPALFSTWGRGRSLPVPGQESRGGDQAAGCCFWWGSREHSWRCEPGRYPSSGTNEKFQAFYRVLGSGYVRSQLAVTVSIDLRLFSSSSMLLWLYPPPLPTTQ